MKEPTFKITFKGMRSFDTLDEAKRFKKVLGSRYRAIQQCDFPDLTFYIVYFEEKGEGND